MTTLNPYIPQFEAAKGLEFGIYTLGDHLINPHTNSAISAKDRLANIVQMAKESEAAGLDIFVVGESHQQYFVTQAHTVVLAAIAKATDTMRISSGATIISTSDPVRVYEDFATLDLISNGRMEIVAGRASRVGAFELFGYDLGDYEALFEEKLQLLLQLNQEDSVNFQGEYRAPLVNAQIRPRPLNGQLPIWRAVGGTRESAVKAGLAGVPMYMAHLGGAAEAYKHTVDAYRLAADQAGHDASQLPVSTAGFFYVAKDSQTAMREYYPHVNEGMKLTNGQGFSKQAFAQAKDVRSIINVGSPQQIIEKILYQYELFGHQRYVAQVDFGGVPYDKVRQNIELLATEVMPAVRKYTQERE